MAHGRKSGALLTVSIPSFSYGNGEVLREIGLSFPGPGLTALLGPNGSGKSTLLRMIGGFLRDRAAAVEIEGQSVARLSPSQIAARIAWVPQRAEIPFAFTVREMIQVGRYRFQRPLRPLPAAEEARMQEWVASVGLTGFLEREVGTLSGGEWQRALIARALAQETPILLLDEPVASLDLHYQDEVYQLLRGLVTRGKVVIVADHQIEVAASYVDRVVVLREGSVAADGSPAAVLTEDLIHRVFGVRREVFPDPVTGTPRLARPREDR